MRATHRDARLPEASHDGGYPDAVWGVRGVTAEAILPDRPAERRKRRRLCAIRAMERLGLLGEENLIPTLAARPELRWLADEEGARWAVLRELGRIGDPETFEEAVAWALEVRPSPEQAGAHVRRLRASTAAPAREASEARGGPRHPRPTRRNRTQEKER
jgi:hypothetical protein